MTSFGLGVQYFVSTPVIASRIKHMGQCTAKYQLPCLKHISVLVFPSNGLCSDLVSSAISHAGRSDVVLFGYYVLTK